MTEEKAAPAREPHDALVVLGPLPVYAAKPYAHLPTSARAVEYVPQSSALRWLWRNARSLPSQWGLRAVSVPVPTGLQRLGTPLRAVARRLLPPEVRLARGVVVTSPFQDSVCELLSGKPIVYHAFDQYESYGWTADMIGPREQRILHHAKHVIVVSEALARLYRDEHRVPLARITVLPNGYEPAPPASTPPDLAGMPAPRLGTIGNVNMRLRLDWVLDILDALPWATWTFVGRVTDTNEETATYRNALARLRDHPRCLFTGSRPYDALPAYAASFDVAVFPLSDHLLNRASSPTRFYSQLPFSQPILVSNECEQLTALQPLVRLCDSPTAFIEALHELKIADFRDGHEGARAELAKESTWAQRGRDLATLLETVVPQTR